jgi:hypothetical protein
VYKTFFIIYSHFCRYSVNVRKCQGDTGTTGNLFVIAFTFEDQPECRTASCRQQFLANVYSNIETIYRNINLPITFTSGQTLNVELIFCSFSLGDIGKQFDFSQNSRNLYSGENQLDKYSVLVNLSFHYIYMISRNKHSVKEGVVKGF